MVTTPNFDLDTDTTLGGSNASDYTIASQKAIKSYVDNSTGATVDQTFDSTSVNAQSGVAIAGELVKYPQKAQNENITGVYNFVGQKKITFSQSTSSDKVGFTCFNASNTEIGALEYRPSTIGNGALLNLNTQYNTTNYVGFRYWGTAVNIVAPKVSTAGNYYIPTHITNGSATVTASNTGTVDISTLLPDVSNFVTNSSLATTLSSYATQTWVGQQGYITGITSSNVTTALGYTPSDNTLSNVSSIDSGSAVKTALDDKADTDLSNLSATGETKIDNSILAILDTLYPIGSIYIGTMSTCPLQTLGIGTWTLVSVGKVLQGAGTGFEYIAGASISASLPTLTAVSNGDHSHNRGTMNISGGPVTVGRFSSSQTVTSGALKTTSGTSRGTGYYGNTTSFDAQVTLTASSNWSGSTNTTGAHTHDVEWAGHVGTTVQPDAYVVNIWERTA